MQSEVELRPVDAKADTCALSSNKHSLTILICIALLVLTAGVYLQTGGHGFLNYDDNDYVTENPHVAGGITNRNIAWALTAFDAANWHPVTWISHMTDVQLFGMNAGAHHLVNVFFHAVTAVLLFLFLSRVTGSRWQSSFVAALFALHPLHVESVAWISERKDVLSAFFCFATLALYAEYTRERNPFIYIIALFTFLLGLMSKPMLVTLPGLMLLMDFWPLKRCGGSEGPSLLGCIKEKFPFLGLSLVSAWLTMYAQQKGGAMRSFSGTSLLFRTENAVVAYVKYLVKAVWPQDLAIPYPFPTEIPLWQVGCSLVILIAISVAAISLWRAHPYLAVGWLWFLITLVPVIGIIQVGHQAIADRYMYIPLVGLSIMAAWGVPALLKGLPSRDAVLAVAAGIVIAGCLAQTWKQAGYWRDDASLFGHAVEVTTPNHIAHSYLGLDRAKKGDMDGAIKEFRASLSIYPRDFEVRNCLGIALANKGCFDDAIKEYQMALLLNPDYQDAYANLKTALAKKYMSAKIDPAVM